MAVFACTQVFAQDTHAGKARKKAKTPEITFESTVYDYGTITQGSNGICEFKFKNTGKADLILTNVRSSCGCTVPTWPREPVPPRKKGVIKVKYNTNRLGSINKSVTVESNAVDNRVVLRLKGNITPKQTEAAPANNNSGTLKAK